MLMSSFDNLFHELMNCKLGLTSTNEVYLCPTNIIEYPMVVAEMLKKALMQGRYNKLLRHLRRLQTLTRFKI